jgi:hypothetical protein
VHFVCLRFGKRPVAEKDLPEISQKSDVMLHTKPYCISHPLWSLSNNHHASLRVAKVQVWSPGILATWLAASTSWPCVLRPLTRTACAVTMGIRGVNPRNVKNTTPRLPKARLTSAFQSRIIPNLYLLSRFTQDIFIAPIGKRHLLIDILARVFLS